jgi:PKHD-type hydroxylase
MVEMLPFYWKWDAELPEHVLAAVEHEMAAMALGSGAVFSGHPEAVRESDVALRPGWHWLAGVLANYAAWANEQARWGFALGKPDAVQFTRYGPGQYCEWHTDALLLSAAAQTRKISVIGVLSGPDEYDGGELELEGVSPPLRPARGSVIDFPAALRHRVAPVTRSVRRTVAGWVQGPNLR